MRTSLGLLPSASNWGRQLPNLTFPALGTHYSALFFPALSLLFLKVASVWKTSSSVGTVRMASPQASNADSEALLNFSVAHAGNAPKR